MVSAAYYPVPLSTPSTPSCGPVHARRDWNDSDGDTPAMTSSLGPSDTANAWDAKVQQATLAIQLEEMQELVRFTEYPCTYLLTTPGIMPRGADFQYRIHSAPDDARYSCVPHIVRKHTASDVPSAKSLSGRSDQRIRRCVCSD